MSWQGYLELILIFLGFFLNTWKRMLAHSKWSGDVMSPLVHCWERDQRALRERERSMLEWIYKTQEHSRYLCLLEDSRGYLAHYSLEKCISQRNSSIINEPSSGCAKTRLWTWDAIIELGLLVLSLEFWKSRNCNSTSVLKVKWT